MKRRSLLKGAAVLPLLAESLRSQGQAEKGRALIKPKRLSPGDVIGVIAPASGLKPEQFDKALEKFESLGLRVRAGKFARGKQGIFSGTDAERVHDLHWAFGDSEIRGVWCVRGGDGAPRILPDVDFDLIRKNPKVFVGYSDITALHTAIHQRCGLVTFHGPLGNSSFSDYTKHHTLNVLMNPTSPYKLERSEANKTNPSELFKTVVITPGKARGRLIGGNLSILAALAGTPWALANMKGKILFMEDIEEPPYRIDRMLTQLRQCIDLRSLAGVALGVFEKCVADEKKPSPPLIEVVKDRLGDLGIPVIYGLSFGHIRDQITLPIGIEAELDTEAATLTFLEAGVV